MIKTHYIFACLALLLAGCETPSHPIEATVPSSVIPTSGDEVSAPLPSGDLAISIPQGKVRIVVYRGTTWGILPNVISPNIKIDGVSVGHCKHDSVIVEDRDPGTFDVSIQTDIVAKETIVLSAGQIVYLKCNIAPIGLLLPAPLLDVVAADSVPDGLSALPRQ